MSIGNCTSIYSHMAIYCILLSSDTYTILCIYLGLDIEFDTFLAPTKLLQYPRVSKTSHRSVPNFDT